MSQAVPAPVTYMATDNACKWAWDQIREDVGTEGWTAGDSCTFHGFFLWGWNYRGQYETQRPAAPPAPAAVAESDERAAFESDWLRRHYPLPMNTRQRDDGRYGDHIIQGQWEAWQACAALAVTPAQEHATQLAGQAIPRRQWTDGTRPLKQDVLGAIHDYSRTKPEDDPEDPESWESWFEAAFDLLGTRVSDIFDEHAAPAQAQEDAPIVWPKSRDVGRIGDMSTSASLRVGLDGDNDTYVSVWDEKSGGSVEFCTPGAGGGKSRRTRVALLALMVAMEADNAEDPRRDWWAARAAQGGAA